MAHTDPGLGPLSLTFLFLRFRKTQPSNWCENLWMRSIVPTPYFVLFLWPFDGCIFSQKGTKGYFGAKLSNFGTKLSYFGTKLRGYQAQMFGQCRVTELGTVALVPGSLTSQPLGKAQCSIGQFRPILRCSPEPNIFKKMVPSSVTLVPSSVSSVPSSVPSAG